MTLFEALRESHDIQRALCTQLLRAGSDTAKREAVFLKLRAELAAHAAAEERYLYVPLLMHDGGLDASRHALAEHHDIDECVDDCAVADKSGDAWMEKARKLSHEVRHHLKEEEQKFFKVAGQLLDEAKKARLARQYQKELLRMRRKEAEDYARLTIGRSGLVKATAEKAGTLQRTAAEHRAARTALRQKASTAPAKSKWASGQAVKTASAKASAKAAAKTAAKGKGPSPRAAAPARAARSGAPRGRTRAQ